MAISYRDTRRRERKQGRAAPFLAAIVIIGGLIWFGPQTAAFVEDLLNTMLALPR